MARQLISPNVQISEAAGMCLSYSRRAFGLPAVEPTAYEAFKKLKHFHADRDFPDVAVPVWFKWHGDLGNGAGRLRYDHVAIRMPGGKVWSSPLNGRGNASFSSVDALVRAFGNGMEYLGWSEDISGYRVAEVSKGGNEVKPTASQVIDAFKKFDTQPTDQQIGYYAERESGVLYRDLIGIAFPNVDEVKRAFKDTLDAEPSREQIEYYPHHMRSVLYKDLAYAQRGSASTNSPTTTVTELKPGLYEVKEAK